MDGPRNMRNEKRKKKRQKTENPVVREYSQDAAARTALALKKIHAGVAQEADNMLGPAMSSNVSDTTGRACATPSPQRGKLAEQPRQRRSRGDEEGKGDRIKQSPVGAAIPSISPTEKFCDLGGISSQLEEVRRIIEFPVKYPVIYNNLGVSPPTGILLHGPPGCGKTKFAHAIAGELQVPFFKISAPEIVSGISGESEAKVRAIFAEATRELPSIIFIDEIDSIAGKRESASREMERRIVATLLTSMDDLANKWKERQQVCMVIGATSRPDSLDPALRRAGRFDKEIAMGIPTLKERNEILRVLSVGKKLDGQIDFELLAHKTPGFVGADLTSLIQEASSVALKRIFVDIQEKQQTFHDITFPSTNSSSSTTLTLCNYKPPHHDLNEDAEFILQVSEQSSITWNDFETALKYVQPSSTREGFTTIPNVSWEDVGALDDVKEELKMFIQRHIRCPQIFEQFSCLDQPVGVLLYGPPGCGKTLVAKAIASESGANFISIKGPELLNKYVGESERSVRTVFSRAKDSAPCVLFFDELDALAPKRSSDSGNAAAERVVNQLLTELDGVKGREGVYVIAASNRVDMIDSAMLRPGRLDKRLYVPLPDQPKRLAILRTHFRKIEVDNTVNIQDLAQRSKGFSGADLAALIREAATQWLREFFLKNPNVDTQTNMSATDPNAPIPKGVEAKLNGKHFEAAFQKVKPSVSQEDRDRYNKMERGW